MSGVGGGVDEGVLVKLSVGAGDDALLPVESLSFDPGRIKWIVVKVTIILVFGNYLSDFLAHKFYFFIICFELENLSHAYKDCIHCPFKHHLIFLDCWVHKVSAKEHANLWVESLLSDLLDKQS